MTVIANVKPEIDQLDYYLSKTDYDLSSKC